MSLFIGENIQTQGKVLSHRIDSYFHGYKPTTEIDENGHRDGNTDNEIKKQKAREQKLSCNFIRIDPNKEDFNVIRATNEIFRNIKQSNSNH